MSDIVTRCPTCSIAFRAEQSQLSAAAGLVRCGTCLKVFDARAHEEQVIPDEINIDYLPFVLDGLEDLSDVTSQLEQQLNNTLSEELEQQIGHEIIDSALATNAENHSKFADMLDDLLDDTVSDQIEIPNPFNDDEPVTDQIKQKSVKQRITVVSMLILGSFAAIIAWIYFNSEALSKKANYRPALTTFCRYIQCPIAEYSSYNGLQVTEFSVQTDPQLGNHINIELLMINQAPNSQRFPDLDIVFTDQSQQPITTSTITPKEYLQSTRNSESLLKANEEIYINMQLPNPGQSATNAMVQINGHY